MPCHSGASRARCAVGTRRRSSSTFECNWLTRLPAARGYWPSKEGDQIAAVASHDPASDPSGSGLMISWLTVAAVRRDFQGTRLPTGERLSDVLVATLIHDALRTERAPVLAGLVAEENVRSRMMCARAGLTEDPAREARLVGGQRRIYVFVRGAFSKPVAQGVHSAD